MAAGHARIAAIALLLCPLDSSCRTAGNQAQYDLNDQRNETGQKRE